MTFGEKMMLSKQTLQASMTVEAALSCPRYFCCFCTVYLSFYLHDKCRIQGLSKNLHKQVLL